MKHGIQLCTSILAIFICTIFLWGAEDVFAASDDGDVVVYKKTHVATTMLTSESKAKEVVYLTPCALDSDCAGFSIIPVKVNNTGLLYLNAEFDHSNDDVAVANMYLLSQYDDMGPSDINWYDIDTYSKEEFYNIKAGSKVKSKKGMPVEPGKTYYIIIQNYAKFYPIETEEYFEVRADISLSVYTTLQRNLSQGTSKWTVASGINKKGETSSTYFKVKPDRTGVMTVSLKEFGYADTKGTVTLYNVDKKKRSAAVMYNTKTKDYVKFGVKKGRTYYLKITGALGTKSNQYKYGVRYSMTNATDRAIGGKSSALRIYRKSDNSTKSLFVAANANSSDYYKLKVTTPAKTKITIKCNDITSGYVVARLYNYNGKLVKEKKIYGEGEGSILTTNKLKKGTYYVKVTKSSLASGRYTIRWIY